jgi:predicted DNA-binding transcriptional regulator AlpA
MKYLTLEQVSQRLNKSKKTISKYIKQGKLTPERVRSKQGTLKYKFLESDIEAFSVGVDLGEMNPEQNQEPQKGNYQNRKEEPIEENDFNQIRELTEVLKEQLNRKDEQIKSLSDKIDTLIERDRETNILLGQLQSKVLMIENPKERTEEEESQEENTEKKTEKKRGFWDFLFKEV